MKMSIFHSLVLLFLCGQAPARQAEEAKDSVEKIFTTIFERRYWQVGQTVSGCGSTLQNTSVIRAAIPEILRKFQIKTMLDIPCGDFNWMKEVPLDVTYIGADIVQGLINQNQQKFGNRNRTFIHRDIICDDLDHVDLIFCRDCLVHLSIEHIWQTLRNIKRSGSKYLLTTCYSNVKTNSDIPTNGSWRQVNLTKPPFNFQAPLLIVDEGGFEPFKCLMLWEIKDLPV